MSAPVVAVVGRANVGKSTLVNRLVGRRVAIEAPEPGVTRDRQGYGMEWARVPFTIVDTGGWEPRAKGLGAKVVAQAERAAREANLILFVVDAETGVTADDQAVARSLRRAPVPVLVVGNKVDSANQEAEAALLSRLGFGEPMAVSALHGRGTGDLLDLVVEHIRDLPVAEAAGVGVLAVAIVGRPNVGKSSLFNRLVGDERAIVDETPGTTRDAIDVVAELDGTRYRFVDTAGMRKRAREAQGPEYYGVVRSLRAIDAADVVMHVIDAAEGATEQDQRIARRIVQAGRAAVVVLNKWDLVEEAERAADDVRDRLRFVSWAPILRTSAKTKRGIAKVLPAVGRAHEAWDMRVATAPLNSFVSEVIERIPLGRGGVRPPKVRYVTQTRTRPPTFVVFASGRLAPEALRALENRLRERFGFDGTPIRLAVRRPKR